MNKTFKIRVYGWGFSACREFWVTLSSGKLNSKWTGPYLITQVFPRGEVKLKSKEGVRFKKNKDRIKLYFWHKASGNKVIEAYNLDEV